MYQVIVCLPHLGTDSVLQRRSRAPHLKIRSSKKWSLRPQGGRAKPGQGTANPRERAHSALTLWIRNPTQSARGVGDLGAGRREKDSRLNWPLCGRPSGLTGNGGGGRLALHLLLHIGTHTHTPDPIWKVLKMVPWQYNIATRTKNIDDFHWACQ